MYCKNCGTRLAEDAVFCGKCGTKLKEQPTPVPQYSQSRPQPQQFAASNQQGHSAAAQGNSSSVLSVLLAILILGGIAVFFYNTIKGLFTVEYDYIGTVKAMCPISDVTYEDLVNSGWEDPRWKTRKGENGIVYVDISGTAKNSNKEIVLTIQLEPMDDPGLFWITPIRVMIDGRGGGEAYASEFIQDLEMNYKYGSGMSDLKDLLEFFSYFS